MWASILMYYLNWCEKDDEVVLYEPALMYIKQQMQILSCWRLPKEQEMNWYLYKKPGKAHLKHTKTINHIRQLVINFQTRKSERKAHLPSRFFSLLSSQKHLFTSTQKIGQSYSSFNRKFKRNRCQKKAAQNAFSLSLPEGGSLCNYCMFMILMFTIERRK